MRALEFDGAVHALETRNEKTCLVHLLRHGLRIFDRYEICVLLFTFSFSEVANFIFIVGL